MQKSASLLCGITIATMDRGFQKIPPTKKKTVSIPLRDSRRCLTPIAIATLPKIKISLKGQMVDAIFLNFSHTKTGSSNQFSIDIFGISPFHEIKLTHFLKCLSNHFTKYFVTNK